MYGVHFARQRGGRERPESSAIEQITRGT